MKDTRIVALGSSLLGSLLIILSMFALNWVSFGGLENLRDNQMLQTGLDALRQTPDGQLVVSLLQTARGFTGWQLLNDVPTMGDGMRALLMAALGVGVLAIVTVVLSLIEMRQAIALIGLIQGGVGLICAVFLFFSSNRIRFLGIDLSAFGPLGGIIQTGASWLNLTVSGGFWACIVGLLLTTLGGALSINQLTSQACSGSRRIRSPRPRPRRR